MLSECDSLLKGAAVPGEQDKHEVTRTTPRETGHTRRDVVRQGVKLAFVAPVLTTFFARDAQAAGSNHSCYPAGHVCRDDGSDPENCCPTLTCSGNPGVCG